MRISLVLFCAFFVLSQSAHAASVSDAYESALNRNETVASQKQRINQARDQLRQAKGSVLPNLTANAAYSVQEEPSDPLVGEFFPSRQPQAYLSLSQPLFKGFREFAALRQRKILVDAESNALAEAQRLLFQDVVSAFLTAVGYEEDLENLNSQLELYEDRIRDLRKRVRVGQSQETDEITARSAQAQIQAEMEVTRGQLRVARENLTSLTGLPEDVPLENPRVIGTKGDLNLAHVNTFLDRVPERPDVKAARERRDAAAESIRIARGAYWPTLDLSGNYYFKRPPGVLEEISWDFMLELKMPLYEGGVIQAQVREASAGHTIAELDLARIRRLATQEIRTRYQSLGANLNQVDALERAVVLAEKNYALLKREYARGLTRNLDVLQALADRRVSQRALTRARLAAQLDYMILLNAAALPMPKSAKEPRP